MTAQTTGTTQSGLDCLLATMMHQPAARIPFMGPQSHDHCMTVARVPARKFYWDAELLVDAQMAVQRWYGFDNCTAIGDAYNFEVEALGGKMIYSDNAMPTVDTNDPLIKTPADLDRLGALDPTKGRIAMGAEVGRLLSEKSPGPLSGGFFCSPFSFLCQAMGYPKAVRAIKRDKVFAQELFDYAENQAIFPYLKAQAEAGVKLTSGADAWAAFPNLTPELVEEWVVPSAQRLGARAHTELGLMAAAGLAATDYCEEDPSKFDKDVMFKCWEIELKLLPAFLLIGMGRTQDWDMNWLQEFILTHGQEGAKQTAVVSLNGRFMRDSTPEQIVAKVREWVKILGPGGAIIFNIGNIPSNSPSINIHTAVKAVHELGRYPLAENLDAIQVTPPAYQPFEEWLKGQPEADVIFKARQK